MREDRLLDRLRLLDKDPTRSSGQDSRRVVDSVLGHLQRILNTRQGGAQIADDYGIPDFTGLLHSIPESLRDIERAIRTIIQKYEPRLRAVRVSFIPHEEDELSLRFQIVAKLATGDEKSPVIFESMVDTDGKIVVTR
jgi:type VI secretion system protein